MVLAVVVDMRDHWEFGYLSCEVAFLGGVLFLHAVKGFGET